MGKTVLTCTKTTVQTFTDRTVLIKLYEHVRIELYNVQIKLYKHVQIELY